VNGFSLLGLASDPTGGRAQSLRLTDPPQTPPETDWLSIRDSHEPLIRLVASSHGSEPQKGIAPATMSSLWRVYHGTAGEVPCWAHRFLRTQIHPSAREPSEPMD
jgi:hypothetical protein